MSVNYASGLSYYANKGVCGLPEYSENPNVLEQKLNELYQLIRHSKFTVVHTGAGISTSSGIPDFRGPNGVWTMERLGKQPTSSVAFEQAVPSEAHRALVALENRGLIHYLITQNIDGLHLRSGFPRDRLSILHGDMFLERCSVCETLYARSTPSPTMGLKCTKTPCYYVKNSSRHCRGKLYDTILDWENDLPEPDYNLAIEKSKCAELHVCIGTSLQMYPAASLPLLPSKPRGSLCRLPKAEEGSSHPSKLVIINLQKTKLAKRAWLNIHAKADEVLSVLASRFGLHSSSKVEVNRDPFIPTIVLRSSHSNLNVCSPWRILPHPTAGQDIRIIESWSDTQTDQKLPDSGSKQCTITEPDADTFTKPEANEPECKRWKTEETCST